MMTCPICGGRFVPGAAHVLKLNGDIGDVKKGKLICSYKCAMIYEKYLEKQDKLKVAQKEASDAAKDIAVLNKPEEPAEELKPDEDRGPDTDNNDV